MVHFLCQYLTRKNTSLKLGVMLMVLEISVLTQDRALRGTI